ncbi:MAG: sulfite exporter TauE/SafE family protein, partial [Bifidobacteriaceae bacterium]|nr:sulfite exporter TauE/SafE family protein [Bifidobacteriaceae bacterium]
MPSSTPDAPSAAPHRVPLWRFGAIGVAGGIASGLFGVGGGIVIVPLLILVGRLDQRQASATSLLAIVPTAATGAGYFASQRQIALVPGVIVGIGAIAGAWVGARVLRVITLAALRWAFVGLLVAVGVWMVFFVPARGAQIVLSVAAGAEMAGLGLAIGLAASLFGIGGGVIAVPALMGLFGAGDLLARGTSLLIMVPAAVTGSIANLRAGIVCVGPGLATGV